jgi:hypothetical protein
MKHETIFSTQKLRMAVLDYGTNFSRRGMDACGRDYSATEVMDEGSFVAFLRNRDLKPSQLLDFGQEFSKFQQIPGVDLLLLVFQSGEKRYLRSVNYLGHRISTFLLDVKQPSCEEVLRLERLVLVESHPPLADVSIDGRKIGEAPVWVLLKEGAYQVHCSLPDQVFKPVPFSVPRDTRVLCQRENSAVRNLPGQSDEPTLEEGASSIFLYLLGAAASVAAVLVPILIFF